MLGDAAGLTGDHVGIADVVQQGSLTVVYMAHHGDHRRTFHQVFFPVGLLLLDFLGKLCGHEFHRVAEFLGHQDQGLRIQALVDGYHHAQGHAGADHLHHRGVVHQGGQVVYGDKLGDLEHLVLCRCGFHLFLAADGGDFALLLAVFGAEVVLGAFVHPGVGLFHLLLDFLLQLFLFGLGHGRFEAVAFLAAFAAGVGLFFLVVVLLGGFLCLNLGDVHFLGAATLDAFAFLALFGIELGQVNLSYDLERSGSLG